MILSDSGTEFKNKLLMQVASTVAMKQVSSSPNYHLGNGHIENVHNFLKVCIQNHVSSEPAWDEVAHIICAAYNFFPNECIFIMFGRYVNTPLVQLLNPKLIYIGNDKSLLALDDLRDIYALIVHNI